MRKTLAAALLLATATLAGSDFTRAEDPKFDPKVVPQIETLKAATSAPATNTLFQAAKPRPITLTISPMAISKPAMKYSLVLRSEDRLPGNAANFYATAGQVFQQSSVSRDYYTWEEELWKKSIAQLTAADRERAARESPFQLYWLSRASQRVHAEWPVERTEGIAAQIPSLGANRTLARRLATDIRFDIHDKKYAEAIDKIRIGMTFGRHLCEGETVIEGLVGVGICDQASMRLRELIEQPDAPNLYWSLSQLPQPLVHLPIENDGSLILASFPELLKVRKGTFTDGDWDSLMTRLSDPSGFMRLGASDESTPRWAGQISLAFLNVRAYPRARAFLKELGRSDNELDAMGAKKVLATYYYESFRVWVDEATKALSLPARESRQIKNNWSEEFRNSLDYRFNPLLLLLPSLEHVAEIVQRADRQIAVLRVIEALRLYAAEHESQFPKSLAECSVPIPDDPVTGRPFLYEIKDGKVIIESPATKVYDSARYELTLRK